GEGPLSVHREMAQEQLEAYFGQAKGFKSIGYSGAAGNISTMKFDINFDKNALAPGVKSFYTCSPKENESIKFIPSAVLAYQWSPCQDFKSYWQDMKAE